MATREAHRRLTGPLDPVPTALTPAGKCSLTALAVRIASGPVALPPRIARRSSLPDCDLGGPGRRPGEAGCRRLGSAAAGDVTRYVATGHRHACSLRCHVVRSCARRATRHAGGDAGERQRASARQLDRCPRERWALAQKQSTLHPGRRVGPSQLGVPVPSSR